MITDSQAKPKIKLPEPYKKAQAVAATEHPDVAAKKLRLPPGETAFMASVANSIDDETLIRAGVSVPFSFNETRSARGVEKKGLVTVGKAPGRSGGEIRLTELGAAWLRVKRGAVAPSS